MENIYIRFDAPRKEFTPKSGLQRKIENAVIKIFTALIPKANPDFENLLPKVVYWKVEYSISEDASMREIGFDKNETSIVAMPLGKNYGFWTDNHLTIEDYEHFSPTRISAEEFNADWDRFEKKEKTFANIG